MSTCTTPGCSRIAKGRKLQVAEQRQAILYTLGHGPVPVWSVHLECKGLYFFFQVVSDCKAHLKACVECLTTYYTDYAEKGQEQLYYQGLPNVFQVADHHYVETKLAQLWRVNTNVA